VISGPDVTSQFSGGYNTNDHAHGDEQNNAGRSPPARVVAALGCRSTVASIAR
jgi:hypothetical protein